MEFFRPAEIRAVLELPLFIARVPCGFPSPDYVEQRLDLNSLLVSHPSSTYLPRYRQVYPYNTPFLYGFVGHF